MEHRSAAVNVIRLIAVVIMACASLFGSCNIWAEESSDITLRYYPCTVHLTGTLVTQERWGPPNFGENPAKDTRVTIYVLRLGETVNVEVPASGSSSSPLFIKGIKEIQIDFPVKKTYQKFVGQQVVIKGQLLEGLAPLEYTKVVIRAQSVRTRKEDQGGKTSNMKCIDNR